MVRSWVVGVGGFPTRVVSEDEAAAGTAPFPPLPSVAPAVKRVGRALDRLRLLSGPPRIDPDLATANAAWQDVQDQAEQEPVIVLFSGHGEVLNNELYLAVLDSERGAKLRRTTLNVTTMLGDVEAGTTGPALFLLDVCGAGTALSAQQFHRLTGRRRKSWVIAACGADESTFGARFSSATAAVLERLAKGWLDVTPTLPHIPIETLAAEIDRELARGDRSGHGVSVLRTPTAEARLDPAPFFANPAHGRDPVARYRARTSAALWQLAAESDPGLDPVHFITRATGTSSADRCLFSGRDEELARIARWMEAGDDAPGLLVVTGSPGSGKSALLGVVACLTHPQLQPVAGTVLSRIQRNRPRPTARVLAVHARRRTTAEVVSSLLRQLHPERAEPPSRSDLDDPDPADDVDTLIRELADAGSVIVVVDALDEAVDPERLLSTVLESASESTRCRVLVGTRPWWDRFPALRAATRTPGGVLDLDAVREHHLARDIRTFLDDRLWSDGRYDRDITAALAARLARSPDHGGFLLATLFADHLSRLPADTAPTPDQVLAQLPTDITGMLDLHLDTLSSTTPWVRPVAAALGTARGRGMPLDLLHDVARACAPEQPPGHLPTDLDDTRDALHEIAFYLRTDADVDGRLLYRYFHQTLVDHTKDAADPAAVLDALAAHTSPSWGSARDYLKRHLADHAAEVEGALDALLTDPGFLVHADPEGLASRLHLAVGETARAHVSVYRTSVTHHPLRRSPDVRRQLLALDALRWNRPALARALSSVPTGATSTAITPQWVTGSLVHPALRHSLPHGPGVEGPVIVELAGRPHALTSSALYGHTSVRLWDLADGSLRHTLRHPDHPSTRVSVADVVEFEGVPHAVTSDNHGVVRVWNLADGTERLLLSTAEPNHLVNPRYLPPYSIVDKDRGRSTRAVVVAGRLYAITPSDGGFQVWDVESGRAHLSVPAEGVDGEPARFTGFPPLNGAPHLVVTAGTHIRAVDPVTGREHTRVPANHDDDTLQSLEHLEIGGTPHLIVQGVKWIRLHALEDGAEVLRVPRRSPSATSYHRFDTDERQQLAIGYDDGVLTWNPVDGASAFHECPVPPTSTAARWLHLVDGDLTAAWLVDSELVVWNISEELVEHIPLRLVQASNPYLVGFIDSEGTSLLVGTDNNLHFVVDLTGRTVRHVFSHSDGERRTDLSYLSSTLFHESGRPLLVTTAWDAVARVWDLTEDSHLVQALGGRGKVDGMGILDIDGRPHAVVDRVGSLALVDLRNGRTVRMTFHAKEPVGGSSTTRRVYVGMRHALFRFDSSWIRVWDFTTGADRQPLLLRSWFPDRDPLMVAVGDHDYAIRLSLDRRTLVVHDLESGATRRLSHGDDSDDDVLIHTRSYGSVGHALSSWRSGGDRCWATWDVTNEAPRGILRHPEEDGPKQGLLTGRAERVLAMTLSGGVVRVWQAAGGKQLHTFSHGPDAPIDRIAAASMPDMSYAFTTGTDWVTTVWDLNTGLAVCVLDLEPVAHGSFSFIENIVEIGGRPHIATLTSAGVVDVWDLTDGTKHRTITFPEPPSSWSLTSTPGGHVQLLVTTGGRRGNGVILVWDLDDDADDGPSQLVMPDPVLTMGMSTRGLVVTFGADIALLDGTGAIGDPDVDVPRPALPSGPPEA